MRDQQAAGVEPNEESTAAIRSRLRHDLRLRDDALDNEVVTATYGLLAQAPSAVLCASLEDVTGAEARPNLPGTTGDARPNWSIALPLGLEELQTDPRPARLAGILRREGS